MSDPPLLWRFTPNRNDPDTLWAIFVQRHALVEDTVERIRESALTGNKHQILFVGPRGIGKTHLVTLVQNRVAGDPQLQDRLRIAWLHEDETTTSLLDLLLRILRALSASHPVEFPAEVLEPLYALDVTNARHTASRLLVERLAGRTLLVIVENLDALFAGLGDEGQKQWRAFLQENPMTSIMATAQQLFDGVSRRTSPFFGFFQVEHLQPLSLSEAVELLTKIARNAGDGTLASYLQTPEGRSRVRALHHLSGGNHRVYIVLSEFIDRQSLDELIGPFEKMLDELTPYYQERLRWLSPQQRKIVEFLCTCRSPVPVKEIARRLFITDQTAASQLKQLRENGYVVSHTRGRESLYELTEPLMRLSFEVKQTGRTPIRLIVDFLRAWYRPEELRTRLAALSPDALREREHICAALERWEEGFRWLEACFARTWPPQEQEGWGDVGSMIDLILHSTLEPTLWRERVQQFVDAFGQTQKLTLVGDGLVRSLGKVDATMLSREALDTWRRIWLEVGKDRPELEIGLRLFDVGMRYLMEGDRRVLLDLLATERPLVEEALGLSPEE